MTKTFSALTTLLVVAIAVAPVAYAALALA